MDTNCESNCFTTLKDHKENIQNNPSVLLLNLTKNEVGKWMYYRNNEKIIQTY